MLLTKPMEYDLRVTPEYDEFSFFKVALTERNWIGNTYAEKADFTWLLWQLHKIDKEFVYDPSFKDLNTNIDIVVDLSIFSVETLHNDNFVKFLEEMEELDYHAAPQAVQKLRSKYRNFAGHVENWTALYGFAVQNPSHPFSQEIMELIDKNVEELGKRGRNTWLKEVRELHQKEAKMMMRGMPLKELEAYHDKAIAKVLTNAEKNDAINSTKLFKYSCHEPLLMYLAICFLTKYTRQYDEHVASNGKIFVSIYKNKSHIEVFQKDSTEFLNGLFLSHQTFLDTLPKEPRRTTGTLIRYFSLPEISVGKTETIDQDKIEVIRAIVKWVADRIPKDKYDIIARRDWIHRIKGDLLSQADLKEFKYMEFAGYDFIGGQNETELLLKVIASSESQQVMFPIFDPSCWQNLHASHCALMAYAICLFHDICIENNYDLLPTTMPDYKYQLVTKDAERHQSAGFAGAHKKNSTDDTTSHRTEHFVTFHFRRLRPGHNASDEARANAKRYGFKELPKNFTFVGHFTRGEQPIDPSEIRISALDVLSRTLGKLNSAVQEEITM